MKLLLRYYGDPILRKKAAPVEKITDEIRDLALSMKKMVDEDDNAIGLAAPQVGHSVRIFVTPVEGENEEGELLVGDTRIYINPVISNLSKRFCEKTEGCLSVPELSGPVVRPVSCTIEAMDLDGDLFSHDCEGFLTRVVLHEYDHLEGMFYFDYIKGKARTLFEKDLKKIKQKYYNTSRL